MALTWEQHQQNIFGGESGGDYDALFGYQNRPNGAFSNVKVSDMSLAQVLEFTNPKGAYGQYVAKNRPDPEVGVATPVGAYQVVGSTLRRAIDALGLDPNQKFDKATQDRIGQYILKTQGTGAWEGYGKGGASMQNKPAQAVQPQQPQQQSQGLLGGILGGQGIGGALGLSDDFRDRLKMGILLGSDPRAFAPMVQAIQARGEQRRLEGKAQASANVTADYLESIGQKEIANLVRQQAIGGAEGLRLGTSGSGTDTTDYKNYLEFIKGMETPISFREFYENYRTKKTPNIQSKGVYRAKDGTIIGEVNFDSSTGEYFQFDENGQRAVLDMRSLTPVTDATFANTIPSYNEFSKMQQELQTDIGSMKALQRYMTEINNTNEGFLRIADDLSSNAKTLLSGIFGEEYTDLTPEELSLRIGRGLQQGLIGRFRLETVGGGVMTEQDALRIIQNLGGDVNALQNKEVVAKQIKNLFMDKQRSYNRNKKRYDIALNQVYRSQGFEDLEDYKPDASVFDLKGKATDKTLDQLVAGMDGLSQAELTKYFQSLTDEEFQSLNEYLSKPQE